MLKDTEYAYAVAKVRVYETALLTAVDAERLITAANGKEFLRLLTDLGWQEAEDTPDFSALLRTQAEKSWNLLTTAAPDPKELRFLIVENDFHNLKAVLKALVAGTDPMPMTIAPALTNPELLILAVQEKKYSLLPEHLKNAAETAYGLITRTADGQLTDIYLDKQALLCQYHMACDTGRAFFKKIAAVRLENAAYKTVLRCAAMHKEADFVAKALPSCAEMDFSALVAAAKKPETLAAYVENTLGAAAAGALAAGISAFEKWCDDRLIALLDSARLISLGPEPLIAYYFAKTAELKTVRMIHACKENGIDRESIEKRVRALYV